MSVGTGVGVRVGVEPDLPETVDKANTALRGRPLLVDTGDARIDAALAGYARVVTGHNRKIVYRIAS